MPQGGGTDSDIVRTVGEIALGALLRPRQETRMTLLASDNTPPARSLRANEEYVRVRLMAAHLPYTRRFLTTYEPLVYAGVSLGETTQEDAEFAKTVSAGRSSDGLAGADRATLAEVTLMEASPYVGTLNLAVGLISVRSSERAKKLMEHVRELSTKAAAPFIGDAGKAIGALTHTVDLLTLDGSFVEVGLMTNRPSPSTGYYALYADRGREDENIKFDFREGRLLNAATGKHLRRPYIVIAIEAMDRRADAAKIPRVRRAMERLLAVIDSGGYTEETVRGLMREYSDAVTFCPDLLPVDRDYLIDAATGTFAKFREARAKFESAKGLESASSVVKPARPTVEDVVADALNARFGPGVASVSTSARENKLPDAAKKLQKLARDGDFTAIGAAARECLDAIRSDTPPIDPGLVKDALNCLRRVRRFGDMKTIAQAAERADIRRPVFMRLYGQALIELEEWGDAERVLTQAEALAKSSKDDTERAEIFGLLGRIQKERFVAMASGKDNRARQSALDSAIGFYRQGERVANSPNDFYHAVNWMALAYAGQRGGLRVRDMGKVRKIAPRILKYVEDSFPHKTQVWDAANAVEASLAIGDYSGAERWLDHYVTAAQGDAFALNSTLRQITKLWGVGPGHQHGHIVQPLQLAVMGVENAAAKVDAATARSLLHKPLTQERREALFSGEAGMAVDQAYRALGMSRFIGKVMHGEAAAMGTGFLLRARDLLPGGADALAQKLALLAMDGVGDGWVFLTNAHVISPNEGVVPAAEALIDFQMADAGRKFRVKRLIWTSPVQEHDCTVLELDAYPAFADDAALALAEQLPARISPDADSEAKKQRPRVLVLGHPAGRKLEITFDNNVLIDHDGPAPGEAFPRRPVNIHYRAPTEGGSSGSPVFNARTLELLAIHHMGNVAPLRDTTPAEGYEANQGKSLRAITYAFEAALRGAASPGAAPAASVAPSTGEAFESLRGYAGYEAGPALEAHEGGSSRKLASECADFIAGFEISSPAYYTRALQAPCWPGGASGLTIGVGYDLRHASAEAFGEHWGPHLSSEIISRLQPYCLLAEEDRTKRKEAVDLLRDIVVPLDAALKVYGEVMVPIYTLRTERCFPNTADLNDLCMGALVSLVFNRGPGLGAGPSRQEMRDIAAHMAAKDFARIPDSIRAMKRIWEGKENLRGLLIRRDKEAALFEEGLKRAAAAGG